MTDNNLNLMDAIIVFMNKYSNREIDTSTLISLLTLSNVLGILTYLNESNKNLEYVTPGNVPDVPQDLNLKDLDVKSLSNMLGSLIGKQGAQKINPMTIINLAKVLSSQLAPPSPPGNKETGSEKEEGKKKEKKSM